jgi:hypothetical protein
MAKAGSECGINSPAADGSGSGKVDLSVDCVATLIRLSQSLVLEEQWMCRLVARIPEVFLHFPCVRGAQSYPLNVRKPASRISENQLTVATTVLCNAFDGMQVANSKVTGESIHDALIAVCH